MHPRKRYFPTPFLLRKACFFLRADGAFAAISRHRPVIAEHAFEGRSGEATYEVGAEDPERQFKDIVRHRPLLSLARRCGWFRRRWWSSRTRCRPPGPPAPT